MWGFVSSDDKMSLQWVVLDIYRQNLPPDANFCYNILLQRVFRRYSAISYVNSPMLILLDQLQ